MDLIHVLATWLHTVAFVIAWGYYGILGRFVLPSLLETGDARSRVTALVAIERRALPFVGLTVVLFIVTGSYLLVTNSHYAGIGNVGASGWAALMLVKHLVIVALVGVGVALDRMIRGLDPEAGEADGRAAIRPIRLCAEAATALGALVALLTAVAQASA